MSDGFWMAFFAFLGMVVVAIKQWAMSRQQQAMAQQIEVVHKATNSMKDALIESTAKASMAEGLALGRKEQKAERKAEDKEVAG